MIKILIALFAVSLLSVPSSAQELKIGTQYAPSIDPHFLHTLPNLGYNLHLFEPLVVQNPDRTIGPALAERWEMIEPTRWRFHLRRDARFHDGSPLTADDVIFSFDRVPNVPNNASSYTLYLSSIDGLEKIDEHTVDIVTEVPNPQLVDQMRGVSIVRKALAESGATADFVSGEIAVGTGPFKFAEYRNGESFRIIRNDGYWGEAPAWESVLFRIMPDPSARVAALQAGDVDLIDFVRPGDAKRLSGDDEVSVVQVATNRILYVGANMGIESSTDITGPDGADLDVNPFRDLRVRKAISYAINRNAIVERIFEGFAEPSAQLAVRGIIGYRDDAAPDEQSYEEAARLLKEAGYEQGFGTAFVCPDVDVYPQICQAVAQMIARIGIEADVSLMPANIFFSRTVAPENDLPLYVSGWNNHTGTALPALLPLLHSYDRDRGYGGQNGMGFADAEVDALLGAAAQEMDAAENARLLDEAMRLLVERYPFLVLVRTDTIFATRRNIAYAPGSQNFTLAFRALPASN